MIRFLISPYRKNNFNFIQVILILIILSTGSFYCSSILKEKIEIPNNINKKAVWVEEKKRWFFQEGTGTYFFWYPNGQIELRGHRINNKEEGLFSVWYENGKNKIEGVFANDLQVGFWQWWWSNGKLKMRGKYIDGKEDGLWEAFDENGVKKGEAIYKDGVKILEKDFSKEKEE